jgi:hypothetical protein
MPQALSGEGVKSRRSGAYGISMSDPTPNVQETLTHAIARHEARNLLEIERFNVKFYKSRHAIALNLLGVIALQVSHPDVPIGLVGQSIEGDPRRDGGVHFNLATAHLEFGWSNALAQDFSEAITPLATNPKSRQLLPTRCSSHNQSTTQPDPITGL